MAVLPNTGTSEDINASLDQELIRNFTQENDRLAEILGIFGTEVMPAGNALKMLKITGTLNDSATEDSSSGAGYIEGDEVALSKYTVTYEPVDEMKAKPYRRLTTAQAVLRSGHVNAVLNTDNKMLSSARASIIDQFFTYLENGTGTSTGKGLQLALANADAALGNALENNNDAAQRIIHFVNRTDAAEYLGNATITDQAVFGMTYLQNFLGATDVFVTSKVASGSLYVTPAENIHILGCDFSSLTSAGLDYETDKSGLVGVNHAAKHDRVSVETNLLVGAVLFAEIKDYIVKGKVTKA